MYAAGDGAGQRADGGDHAAVVLEVVVGVGDVVLAGVGVLRRDRDPLVRGLHLAAGRDAVDAAAVGVAAPDGVDLGEVGVVAPVAGVDELQQARAVRAGLGAEDPGRGRVRRPSAWARATKFCSAGSSRTATSRTASSSSARTCGNASRKKPEMRTVTSMRGRPSSSRSIASRPVTRRRRLVPDGADAEQREDLGDVVAGRAHRARAPHGQADAARVGLAVVGAVALEQRLGHRLAGLPGEPGGDGLGVDGVEVAAGRQDVDQPAQRRPGRPGGNEAAVQRVQHAWSISSVVPASRGTTSSGGEPQHAARPSSRRPSATRVAPAAGSQPAASIAGDQRAGPLLDLVDAGLRVAADSSRPRASRRPGRLCSPPQIWRARRIASTRSTRASPGGARAEDVQTVADLGVLDLAQPAVDVQQEVVEAVLVGAVLQAEVVVELGGLDQRPDLLRGSRAASPGPARRCWRARRAAARAGRCRRRSRRGPSAGRGGRRGWRARGAWPGCPRPGR